MKNYAPSLSLKEAETVMRHAVGDDDLGMIETARAISEAASRVEKTVTAILRNPMQTDLKNRSDAKAVAEKVYLSTAPKIDKARKAVEEHIDALDRAIAPKAPANAAEALYHGEVRAAIARAPKKDRARMIEAALDDDQFVAAAVLGNPVLTGLTKSEQDALASVWKKKRHGETVAQVKRLTDGLAKLDQLTGLFGKYALGMFADDNGAIEAAERSEALAQEAIKNAAA